MLLWQRAAEARAGTDPDESTVMDRDIAIYQTVDADADSDGPGSDRGRAHRMSEGARRGYREPIRDPVRVAWRERGARRVEGTGRTVYFSTALY